MADSGRAELGRKRTLDVAQQGAKITTNEPTKVFSRLTYYAATPEPAREALKTKLKAQTGPRKTCK